ncbi:hypothetical protein [Bradyrhizobium sp. SZCCHNR3118]|uniref:hypothetical protein n=1 Tax=Bradyrhizobium sp. SZCCHNR3118 TaxID=3057468 RepID=UPI002916CBC6|nr:hypothetical protein [Bradyrhizobium sp. SZCCHNR3118]
MDTEAIERRIIRKFVEDAIADGNTIDVYDDGDFPLRDSADADAILSNMFATCLETLYLKKDGKRIGCVAFVHGNGHEVISDYTVNLTELLAGAEALAESLEEEEHG